MNEARHEIGAWWAALIPAGMLCVLLSRSVWDVDVFWQLKLGELILNKGAPLRSEPFAALHIGEPMPAVAWLGQVIMALTRQIGGWPLLRLVDAMCWVGGLWACAAACRARGATTTACALALGVTFLLLLPTASVRPQSFAALCFGALLAMRRLALPPFTSVLLAFPLFLVWQNLHPSVSVATIAMAAVAVTVWLQRLAGREGEPWVPTALSAMSLAAMFATPDGVSIVQVSVRNTEASVAIGASEWLPLWAASNHFHAACVMACAAVALALVMRHPKRVDASELAVAGVLLVMTIFAYRFVLFWGAAMVPVFARVLTPEGRNRSIGPRSRLVLLASLLTVAATAPLLIPTRFAANIPLEAIASVERTGVRGTVYADYPYGGAIIDTGFPRWRVAYDGRYYRYSSEEWKYNGGIENGYVPLIDVVRKWRPCAFILNKKHNAPLVAELSRSSEWRLIYDNGAVAAFVASPRGLPAPAHP
jgi:hypothetical protein